MDDCQPLVQTLLGALEVPYGEVVRRLGVRARRSAAVSHARSAPCQPLSDRLSPRRVLRGCTAPLFARVVAGVVGSSVALENGRVSGG